MTLDADGLRALWQKTLGTSPDAPELAPGRTYKPVGDEGAPAPLTTGALPRATLSGGGTLAGGGTISGGGTLAGGGTLSGGDTVAGDEATGAAPAAPGTGRFELLQELGRGGMGVVFRARQESLGRDVAVKRLLGEKHDDHTRRRFLSEALVTGVLDHPNVVPVHELGVTPDGELFMAMKLVGGTSWHDLLHPRTPEQHERARRHDREAHVQTLLAVCNAIAFAHSRGIVHRDLKPENVMVGDFGEVLVMDWGIALDVSPTPAPDARAPHRSSVSAPSGTPSYMPPELAEGRGQDIGPWTDVYLLGATLHEVLTGGPPHQGRTLVEVLLAAARSTPPRYGPDVPQGLAKLCTKAMARDPRERHPTVLAFQEELRAYLKHRESLLLSERADEDLRALEVGASGSGVDRDARYERFARAIARYEQALDLWTDNAPARLGARRARLAHAREALAAGDLGLAAAQTKPLPADDADARALRAEIDAAQAERAAAARRARTLRAVAGVSVLGVVAALGVGYALVSRERDRALVAQEAEARERERAEANEQTARAAQAEAQARAAEARERLRLLLTQRSRTERDPAVGALHLIATLGPELTPELEHVQRLRIRALLDSRTPPARTFSLGWAEGGIATSDAGAQAVTFDAQGRAWALTRGWTVVELSLGDVATETVGAPLELPPPEEGYTRSAGRLIAAGPRLLVLSDVDLVVIDLATRAVAWKRTVAYQPTVVPSPDGARLFVAWQADGSGRILDAATGTEVVGFIPLPLADHGREGAALTAARLIRAATNGALASLHGFDLARATWTPFEAARELIPTSPAGEVAGRFVASPDGELVAASTRLPGDRTGLVLLDAATGACVRRLVHPSSRPADAQLVWLGARRLAVVTSADGEATIHVVDGETGDARALPSVALGGGARPTIAASPDGRTLALTCEQTIDVIDTSTGLPLLPRLEGLRGVPYDPARPCFSPDGGLLLAVDTANYAGGGPAQLWSLVGRGPEDRGPLAAEVRAAEAAQALDQTFEREHEPDHPVVFTYNTLYEGAYVSLSRRATDEAFAHVYRVPAFDPSAPEGPPLQVPDPTEVGGVPVTMATSRDGRWFAIIGNFAEQDPDAQGPSYRLRVADLEQRRWLPWERPGPSEAPLRFLPDGRLAVFWRDALEVLDVTTQQAERVELPAELAGSSTDDAPRPGLMAVSTSGSVALLARGDAAAVAAIGSGMRLGPVQRLGAELTRARLFADQRRGYVLTAHEVRVLDLERQTLAFPPLRVAGELSGVELSPDGRRVVLLGTEARVFDAATGRPVGGPMAIEGRSAPLELAFGEGGLVALAQAGELQVWELDTALPVSGVISRAGSNLNRPRFEDGGQTLVARDQEATDDETVVRELAWRIDPDERPLEALRAEVELRAGCQLDESGYPVPLSAEEAAARARPLTPVVRPSWPPRLTITIEEPADGARLTTRWTRVRARLEPRTADHAVIWARTPTGRTARTLPVADDGAVEGWLALPEQGERVQVGARAVARSGLETVTSVRVTAAPAPAPPVVAGMSRHRTERLPDGREVEVWQKPLPAGPPLELVWVPAGPFLSEPSEQGFWVGRTEVTWEQYMAFCQATGRREPPAWYRPEGTSDVSRHPVKGVTWRDAVDFAAWAGASLPTDEEWSRLSSGLLGGPSTMRWGWGSMGPRSHGRHERGGYVPDPSDGFLDTAPVGSFPEDVSPWGALDVEGNVHEWLHTDVPEQGVKGRGGSYLTRTSSTGTSRYLGPDKVWHVSDIGLRVVIRAPGR